MNVTVEHLAPCKRLLRVEVDSTEVDNAFEEATREIMKLARLPGFRPGKAPRHLVTKAFAGEIENQVRRRLISENFRKALDQEKYEVIGRPEIEEIQFARGQALQFAATVETAPEFELPEYKGLPVKREMRQVTDEDLERALKMLQEQRATYQDVDRPIQDGDFAVIHYSGTVDGRPITELSPTSRGLAEKRDFWVHIEPGSFIAGFTEQLIGAKAGESRTVEVDFPSDFVAPKLAGLHGVYQVEVAQVKEKVLPALSDELAKLYGADTFEELKSGVWRDLENELKTKQKRTVRDQLVRELLSRVTCDLPASAVEAETRNVVYDIVRENQQRGVPREAIDQQKDQIFSVASNNARDRVKASFVLSRIAAREGIQATREELSHRIVLLAEHYGMKPEKMVKELQEKNGLGEINEQVVTAKVLDFLEANARIEEVLPTTPAAG